MNLRDFISSHPESLKGLKQEVLCDDTTLRILGIVWDSVSDEYVIKLKEPFRPKNQ